MINDLKLGVKLLRYTYGIKMNVALVVVCGIMDLLFFGIELGIGYVWIDGYFLLAIGMVPVQLIFSLNAVNNVLSSPARKKLQTTIPAVMSWCAMEGMYVLVVLKKLILALVHPDMTGQICTRMVMLALLAVAIMAFTGILYKYFIMMVLMTCVLAGFIQFVLYIQWNLFGQSMFSLVWAALIGFALITVGAAMQYGISLLTYKKPVSKMSVGVQLRSEL